MMRLIVRTEEGPVAVLVAEVPEEIKQEDAEEQGVDEKLEDFWSDIEFGRNPEPWIEGVPNPYREEEPWCPSDLQSLKEGLKDTTFRQLLIRVDCPQSRSKAAIPCVV
ncbi:hypothetical protein V7S43_008623 [Phytophthora oleae]|uniref:Uncharacterized protein n=1 Tax=Phytophthora oleae TaxID=2107226 RepID=A0ABD3FJ14_9STRA